MAFILAIDTSTKNCSVALFNNQRLVSIKEKVSIKYSHSEQIISFINNVLDLASITINDLDVVAISKGPGSYTGLRIGVSTAKGLCYALDIPLISISTLRAMAYGVSLTEEYTLFCPMIDAKRMEVFSAIFDKNNNQIREVRADIVKKETYEKYFDKKIVFFGDGALKCKEIISNVNVFFLEDIFPSAKYMGFLAYTKFIKKDFENIAYFEPYYLKDFVTGRKT